MPANTTNTAEELRGIAGEVRTIMGFAMSNESELEPMLATVTRLLRKGLTRQVEPTEAMEVALAVVDAVSEWLKRRTDPMWAGGGPRIANAMRARLTNLRTGRAPARARGLVIARARREYLANGATLRKVCAEAAFVNQALREADQPLLTNTERASCTEV